MKWTILMAFAAVLVSSQPTTRADGDKSFPRAQMQFNLRVLEGDPLGSEEAGTIKVLAEPRLTTAANRSFSFARGNQLDVPGGDGDQSVQCGLMIEGKPSAVKDSKVHLDITLSNTTFGEGNEQRQEFHSETVRSIITVRFGEVIKLRWRGGKADKQAWAELSVQEVKP